MLCLCSSLCHTYRMVYVFLFFSVILILMALFIFRKFFGNFGENERSDSNLRTQKDEKGKVVFVCCPICSTPLAKNENLHSKIFRPMNTPDQRMTVQGCPHCYPVPEPGIRRTCPVCGKPVPVGGEVIARLFNRTAEKKHVMIVGCENCNKR